MQATTTNTTFKKMFMNKIITKLLLGVLFVLGVVGANAQVTVTNPANTMPARAFNFFLLKM